MLEWQAGYGVVSFGTKNLEWVKAYVRNQRSGTPAGQSKIGWSGSRLWRKWLKPNLPKPRKRG